MEYQEEILTLFCIISHKTFRDKGVGELIKVYIWILPVF